MFVSRFHFPVFFLALAHRAFAALRALALRCSRVIFLAVAFPPLLPNFRRYSENALFLVIDSAQPVRIQFFYHKKTG